MAKFKKYFLLYLYLFSCSLAFADSSRIYLLTSINAPTALFRSENYFEKSVDKIFKIAFQNSKYKIIIKHKVDQVELRSILLDFRTVGVFWISHSNHFFKLNGPLISNSIVADYNGLNAKQIFQSINPNLRYLGFVGCRAKSIFDKYSNQFFKITNPDLKIFSSKKKLSPKNGLIKAINYSVDYLGNGDKKQKNFVISHIKANTKLLDLKIPRCKYVDGIKIKVRRIINSKQSVKAIKFLMNSKSIMIGSMPEFKNTSNAQVVQEETLFLSKDQYLMIPNLNIHVESMQGLGKLKPNFGQIIIENGEWDLFKKFSGEAYGFESNFYIFKGNLPYFFEETKYIKYKCHHFVD